MTRRSRSSNRWLQEHFADPFVQRAQRAGLRSRAVFKLEEVDRKEKLLRTAAVCLDLGAAPGAWSQYAASRVGRQGRVVASDILAMPELAGVEFVQGDFTQPEVFERVRASLPSGQVDTVLSDMAPNMTGIDVTDQARSLELAELALEMAAAVLKPGGDALIKAFQGAGFPDLVRSARARFTRVKLVKPSASRSRSPEIYLLARQFRLV
jgi:23S rRNA (uridine2552-2'-O)-methyltransferase